MPPAAKLVKILAVLLNSPFFLPSPSSLAMLFALFSSFSLSPSPIPTFGVWARSWRTFTF